MTGFDTFLSPKVITDGNHASKLEMVTIDPQADGYDEYDKRMLGNAQKLRASCFQEQFGAVFVDGIDRDEFDESCVHVLVISSGQVVATTRLLSSQRANVVGRFYGESEFELKGFIRQYPYNIVEVGRTCVHAEHRHALVLRKLWQGITQFAGTQDANAFMGCCSIPIGAGDINGWLSSLSAPKISVRVRHNLPLSLLTTPPVLPSLLQMYLRMGASLSEQVCFDPDFHCADVWVWLPFEQMQVKYQHLLPRL